MTVFVLVLGVALLLAVLTSALASRSALSTTAVFLLVGLLSGPLGLDLASVHAGTTEHAAEIALFAVLFTDGQHAPWQTVRECWRSCTRVLIAGMPLTFGIVAVLAHVVVGLPWLPALVAGAILSPTDPVFASALVGRDDVPIGVRRILNIESGLNDGLALPAVLLLAGLAGGSPEGWSTDPLLLLAEIGMGIAIGIVVPLLIRVLQELPGVGSVERLLPLGLVATALLVYGLCALLDANQFLAAFVAGATVATIRPAASEAFRHTGELASELAKGIALLAFAMVIDSQLLDDASWSGFVFALLAVAVARPLPVIVVLLWSHVPWRERLAIAWFGPKGFASVAYAVIVGSSGMDGADSVVAIVAVTVLVSALSHSSTDVAVAARLASGSEDAAERQAAGEGLVTSPP